MGTEYTYQAIALYKAYHNWAQSAGEIPLSQKRFGGGMTERGFNKVKNGIFVYHGLTLKNQRG